MASFEELQASATDNLEDNPFYKLLQGKYKKKFENARNACFAVCIPSAASLKNAVITSDFVDCHLLNPSPYLKGHYFTSNGNGRKEIEIDGNQMILKTGFPERKSIKILGGESGYNKNFEPFQIIILDAPLCRPDRVPGQETDTEKFWKEIQQTAYLTFSQSERLLGLLPDNKQVLDSLEKQVQKFEENYLLHSSFLLEAADKLIAIVDAGVQELSKIHKQALTEQRFQNLLAKLIETYVFGRVHKKVFPVICQRFSSEDRHFLQRLKHLSSLNVTADQLGVKESFCCSQTPAIVELASLDAKLSAQEKMHCINMTMDLIMDTIKREVKENEVILRLTDGNLPVLTSDELVPLMVTVIIQAKLSHLASSMFYIENFQCSWTPSSASRESFSLVTFQAAVEYIKKEDFVHLQPRKMDLKREISLVELMQMTERLRLQEEDEKEDRETANSKSNARPRASTGSVCMDRELQKLTKMIEASTRELQEAQRLGVPRERGHQRSRSLSDYFCSSNKGKHLQPQFP